MIDTILIRRSGDLIEVASYKWYKGDVWKFYEKQAYFMKIPCMAVWYNKVSSRKLTKED